MSSDQVLKLARDFTEATGNSSEDWDLLCDWIRRTHGDSVLAEFIDRTRHPI